MAEDITPGNGQRFGEFEVLERLGQGGMSTVYKARDTRTQAIVALKIASSLVIHDPHLSRRFELEFALSQPLHHPHLVGVFENGVYDRTPYLVLEYIDGPNLAQHLKKGGRLAEADALALILPIADALHYLHEKQIIHRDVKPANILLTSKLVPKLADLGLVKNLESLSRLTRSNLGLGTMHYVSPEQFEDASTADVRSDIYSLAATLYLMLTGENPFGKGTTTQVITRKLMNEFDPPVNKVPNLRPAVNAAICKALQADRKKRPATIREFADLLTQEKKKSPAPKVTPKPPAATKAPALKPEPSKKQSSDLRHSDRYPVELEAACRAVVNVAGKRWPAWVIDISSTGLCLNGQRRFEVGSVIEVSFTLRADDTAITQVVRVRWAKQTAAKSWYLGCEFVNPLSEDDLNIICGDGLDQTRMI